jgi:hypothetical protein
MNADLARTHVLNIERRRKRSLIIKRCLARLDILGVNRSKADGKTSGLQMVNIPSIDD